MEGQYSGHTVVAFLEEAQFAFQSENTQKPRRGRSAGKQPHGGKESRGKVFPEVAHRESDDDDHLT